MKAVKEGDFSGYNRTDTSAGFRAADSTKKEFDVEIQRKDAGAGAKRARYYKQDKKGVAAMCKIMEDMRNEAALNRAKKTAMHLIRSGKMSLEDIAEATELPLDVVGELEIEVMQLA